MIQTIHLDRVLREAVPGPFGDLVTRPTGAAVRGRIQQVIAEAGCELARLDFSAVRVVDFSCADEVVAKLLLAAHPRSRRYVVLCGLSEAQVEAIDHVLTGHRLAVGALPAGGTAPVVLGWATPDDRQAFDAVTVTRGGTATRIAEAMDRPVHECRPLLRSLATRRLVRAAAGAFHPLILP